MATDPNRGKFVAFQDFGVTAIGDLPEIDVLSATGVTTAILAGAHGGVVEIPMGTSNDDDCAAVSFGDTNWLVAQSDLEMEARMRVEVVTDMKFFVGFGDTIASADETTFSATTDTITLDTMSNAVGFLYDEDATSKVIWCVAGASDVVTVGKALSTAYTPLADVYHTYRVHIAKGGRSILWSIDGKEVHRVTVNDDASVLVGATAALVPGVWNYEQATAADIELDYLQGAGWRGTA